MGGGPEKMEPFLKFYYTKFAYKSIDSNTFKETFLDYYKDTEAVKDIDWDTWFNKPGMPIWNPSLMKVLARFVGTWQRNGKIGTHPLQLTLEMHFPLFHPNRRRSSLAH